MRENNSVTKYFKNSLSIIHFWNNKGQRASFRKSFLSIKVDLIQWMEPGYFWEEIHQHSAVDSVGCRLSNCWYFFSVYFKSKEQVYFAAAFTWLCEQKVQKLEFVSSNLSFSMTKGEILERITEKNRLINSFELFPLFTNCYFSD